MYRQGTALAVALTAILLLAWGKADPAESISVETGQAMPATSALQSGTDEGGELEASSCTVRFLVPTRERRRWSSELIQAVSVEFAREQHRGRILSGYPRTDVHLDEGKDGQGKG